MEPGNGKDGILHHGKGIHTKTGGGDISLLWRAWVSEE